LSDWEVAETADKTGYKIIFWHGRKFYGDQVKRSSKAHKARRALTPEVKGSEKKALKLSREAQELAERLRKQFDVAESKSLELVGNYPLEKVRAQVESFSFRRESVKNMSGFIIRAIESDYSLPEKYLELLKKKERGKAEKARKAAIDACRFCDEMGQRNVKSESDPFYGVMHECTHDPEIEKEYEEHIL